MVNQSHLLSMITHIVSHVVIHKCLQWIACPEIDSPIVVHMPQLEPNVTILIRGGRATF